VSEDVVARLLAGAPVGDRIAMARGLVPDYADALTAHAAALVPYYVRHGWADDEILDQIRDREPDPRAGELGRNRSLTLREQRAAAAYLAALRQGRPLEGSPATPGANDPGYPTREQIEAAMADGLHGYGRLAKRFRVGKNVIRRRLGRLAP
jgi:hypothetical protein